MRLFITILLLTLAMPSIAKSKKKKKVETRPNIVSVLAGYHPVDVYTVDGDGSINHEIKQRDEFLGLQYQRIYGNTVLGGGGTTNLNFFTSIGVNW